MSGEPEAGAGVQLGDRVTINQFGLRGKIFRVEAARLDGTFDVRPEDGGLLIKRIQAGNLTPYRPADPWPATASTGVAAGQRVTLHVLGFRGKAGTVTRVRPDGTFDVRVDGSPIPVTRVPAAKLTAL